MLDLFANSKQKIIHLSCITYFPNFFIEILFEKGKYFEEINDEEKFLNILKQNLMIWIVDYIEK